MVKQKNDIDVKLIQGNLISNPTKPDVELYKELVEKGKIVEEVVHPALVISRLDYPVVLNYGESKIRLSPRSILKVGDVDKLGELEKGVFLKKITSVKVK